jgi:PmbA protein
MTAIAGEGTGMERDYDYSSVRHAADLEKPEKIGRTAAERAIQRLNPRKVSTRKVPVVFDPRVANSLVSHLASAANGASVARKTSFLREKMGAKLFADGIRIVDDPHRVRGLRSHPFDGEGVGGKRMTLV